MAKRTIHMLVDDIDGGEADETVRFAVDGVQYEIDLSTKNATKMRDALARYIQAGSKLGRAGAGTAHATAGRRRRPATVDRDQNRAIREWAQGKGIAVSDRGRIKQEIVDRYNAEAGRCPVSAPMIYFGPPGAPGGPDFALRVLLVQREHRFRASCCARTSGKQPIFGVRVRLPTRLASAASGRTGWNRRPAAIE